MIAFGKNKLFFILFVILFLCLYFFKAPLPKKKITIAVASNLQTVMKEIVKAYQKDNPTKLVDLIFASSGNLYAQIEQGAPFDLFFSADMDYPRKIFESQKLQDRPVVYAIGHLVIWSLKDWKINLKDGFSNLLSKQNNPIALPNPKTAPYGKKIQECLEKKRIWKKIFSKVVWGKNVSQTAQFLETGNAKIGIIPLSLALDPPLKGEGDFWEIPSKNHSPIYQGYVIMNSPKKRKNVQIFLSFFHTQGQVILKKYGYTLP